MYNSNKDSTDLNDKSHSSPSSRRVSPATSRMNVFIKITAKKLSAQKLYFFKIPKWYLDKRNIVFRPISLILDEINDSYLMNDAFDNKVWIPKKMIQSELIEN